MAMFSGLGEKLNHIFSKLTKRGKLTELEIKQAMREVRVALLEADVNFMVAKDFINKVSEKAVGENILNSLTPGQQVIKIVNEELIALMGSSSSKLEVAPKPPTIIMMCGLQGAGKTTMCGKLGMMLRKQGKKPMLVACDVYRPAAVNQLKIVAGNANVDFFEKGINEKPEKIAKEGIEMAIKKGCDTVIIDTAGRLQINEELMQELENIKALVNPTEILLTVDAMTGQEAVNVSKEFDNRLDITGVILTKLDGDTRGGAALSIKAVIGKPIKFCGVGEKMGDIEPFHPDRMASRILGMGDVLTLIEKAQESFDQEEMKKLEENLRRNTFTFDDFLVQFEQISKMGSLTDILSMMPGMGGIRAEDVDESKLKTFKAIIQSMTKKERNNPDLIKASQRKRIAQGSGTTIQEVNQLIKQFEQIKLMMKNQNNPKLKKLIGRFY